MTHRIFLKSVGTAIPILFVIFSIVLLPHVSFAATTPNSQIFPNPSTSTTICGFLVSLLNIITEIGAILGALAIIGVGFYYIYARGKPEKLSTAHHALLWTILGVTMLLGASVLAHILITTVNAVLTAGGSNFVNQSELTCSP